LRGSYGFSFDGFIIPSKSSAPLPYAAVGRFTLDRDGDIVITETVSVNGSVYQQTITGTLTVDERTCMGTAQTTTDGAFNFVVMDDKKEFRIIGAEPTTTIVGVARKQ
jgi:hypothetical protein